MRETKKRNRLLLLFASGMAVGMFVLPKMIGFF
ncbi:hypothetical protein ABID49_000402 [Bhargavaea ullalensis]|uniref:Uncharacterized protein n=1 Tax=Bhargavaea ullalensis TaxID=1265685 RepID=A0ABV2G8B5_9BACL